jgi:hypothetical protein
MLGFWRIEETHFLSLSSMNLKNPEAWVRERREEEEREEEKKKERGSQKPVRGVRRKRSQRERVGREKIEKPERESWQRKDKKKMGKCHF